MNHDIQCSWKSTPVSMKTGRSMPTQWVQLCLYRELYWPVVSRCMNMSWKHSSLNSKEHASNMVFTSLLLKYPVCSSSISIHSIRSPRIIEHTWQHKLFNCNLICQFVVRCKEKCLCYFKKCVWPWTMKCFIEILTNQSRSYFKCPLKSSTFCIMLIINVYECNNG